MLHRFGRLFFFVLMFAMSGVIQAQPPSTADGKLKQFMQRKLEYSKGVLEGLALSDTDKIVQNSQGLSLMSMESAWNVLTTEKYLQQSMDFRRAADGITAAAKDGNVDRATLGYFDLTLRCVNCHKAMREKPSVIKRDKEGK